MVGSEHAFSLDTRFDIDVPNLDIHRQTAPSVLGSNQPGKHALRRPC